MPSSSTASYTAASNQVASVNGGAGLVYDAAGDVTQDPLNSYLYDAEGRLCAAKTAGPSLTGYIYDATGIRVAKGSLTSFSCNFATNGFTPTASYVLGPGGVQVTEYAVSGATSNWVHTNAFSGGKIQATYDGTDTTFYLGDWLGSKRVEVGASGCATGYASLAYGDGLTTVSLPGFTACASDATEHHFTGKERDTESGNDYFGARYYASSMGRFMSPDWSAKEEPVPYAMMDNPQTLNLYAYVGNNPLSRVDADGHTCPPDCPKCNSLPTNPLSRSTPEEKQAQKQSVHDTEHPNNGHEESGVSYTANGQKVIAPAQSGPPADPSKVQHASADPYKAADPSKQIPVGVQPDEVWHTHSSVQVVETSQPASSTVTSTIIGRNTTVQTYSFDQSPSYSADIPHAAPQPTLNLEFGVGNHTVYVFDSSGTTCQASFKEYFKN